MLKKCFGPICFGLKEKMEKHSEKLAVRNNKLKLID